MRAIAESTGRLPHAASEEGRSIARLKLAFLPGADSGLWAVVIYEQGVKLKLRLYVAQEYAGYGLILPEQDHAFEFVVCPEP